MGESIQPLRHRGFSSVIERAHRRKITRMLIPKVKAFFLLHYWKVILSIGIFVLLLETIEHLPAVTNKTPFYLGEVFLIGLLLLITGFLIHMLARTVAQRTEALNILRVKKDITQQMAGGYDIKDVSRHLVQEVSAVVPGAGIELYLYGDPQNRLYRTAFAQIEPSANQAGGFACGSDSCQTCFLQKSSTSYTVSACRSLNCPIFTGGADDFCLQLSRGNWLLGILHLVAPAGDGLQDAQVKLLENVASDISSALEIAVRKIERDELSLAQKVNSVQLDIARDLHDTIGQNISYLRMKLEHLAEYRLAANITPEIQQMASVANESYDLVRGTLAMLQPNRSAHLHELFEGHAQQIMERTGIEIEITCHGEPRQISTRQMRQLFYIFREALSNIEKHANASRVRVATNWLSQEMTLTVTDDGRGFDLGRATAENHYGLKFMRDRIEQLNGQFDIWSKPGEGTRLVVCFPYEEEVPYLPISKSVHEQRIL